MIISVDSILSDKRKLMFLFIFLNLCFKVNKDKEIKSYGKDVVISLVFFLPLCIKKRHNFITYKEKNVILSMIGFHFTEGA